MAIDLERKRAGNRKYQSSPEVRARKAAWAREYKKRPDAKQKARGRILARYGLTQAAYDAMLAAQGGTCAICHGPPGKHQYHVDHDHRTGAVRALICNRCNRAIGYFKDSPALCMQAAKYLEKHGQPQ